MIIDFKEKKDMADKDSAYTAVAEDMAGDLMGLIGMALERLGPKEQVHVFGGLINQIQDDLAMFGGDE